tara:strand:- start:76 stop:954 length:879 start_codon:yes stop_codon:yes gene_type:complete
MEVVRCMPTGRDPSWEMSHAIIHFTLVFANAEPNLVLVLGDRYETLAAALAAMFLKIPVAHIHGGEETTGAFDDPMRHAITHIADLHFVATRKAFQRVVDLKGKAMGVHLVGAPGLDGIKRGSARRSRNKFLVTYHPETMKPDNGVGGLTSLLEALDIFPAHEVVFTGVNNDPGNKLISAAIEEWVKDRPQSSIKTDGDHDWYVWEMERAAAVIGNSSAGIIEAPYIGCPTVNIGYRQEGREKAASIFDTPEITSEIVTAIRDALSFDCLPYPIYVGGASTIIARILDEETR